MKKLKVVLTLMLALIFAFSVSASACTMIFAGSATTEDGSAFYGRSEDYYNSRNKLFFVVEAGEISGTYSGCPAYGGGFTMELEKTGYSFITFAEDNADGYCPECYEEATHLAYTEAGTNEMGVTVSGTETLRSNGEVTKVDPFRDGEDETLPIGIEETDIPTVILSQAATAREGVELLLNIYDTYGCQDAAGLIIADNNEIWYIENTSGTQYIAIKLTENLIILEPNMAVIGLIDLDDTENVIASANLIQVAKQAGTFVGDEANNVIDFRASYSSLNIDSRLVNGLNFINSSYNYTAEILEADNTLFTISNLDAEGNIVPLYTNITADRALTIDDMVNYYKIPGIGRDRNADTSIFQFLPGKDAVSGTVEWVALNNCAYNVFLPYFPALTNDTWEGFKVGTGVEGAGFETEAPESGMYYAGSTWVVDAEGNWARAEGYITYPEGWEKGYYWTFDALSNYILYRDADETKVQNALDSLASLQTEIYSAFDTMLETVSAGEVTAETRQTLTDTSNALAEKAQTLAYELYLDVSAE